jgi:magnesium and cobalt transporter
MQTERQGATDIRMEDSPKRTLVERLSALILREPEDRNQLLDVLHNAREKSLLDDDALAMIEGVLQTSELTVKRVMVTRRQMDLIDANESPEEFIPRVIETAHSRFPVFEGEIDNVIGVLLAKDLLRYYVEREQFNMRDLLRPVVFVPESKKLNVLLKEFRTNRHHLAIVVDEYGSVAGLVTIEDVLEQIVGDIEDEHDSDDDDSNAASEFTALRGGATRVLAGVTVEGFNKHFDAELETSGIDTIGGVVVNAFGRVPKQGEKVDVDGWRFTVQRADTRRLHVVVVKPIDPPESLGVDE